MTERKDGDRKFPERALRNAEPGKDTIAHGTAMQVQKVGFQTKPTTDLLKKYLNEAGKHPRISAVRERELGHALKLIRERFVHQILNLGTDARKYCMAESLEDLHDPSKIWLYDDMVRAAKRLAFYASNRGSRLKGQVRSLQALAHEYQGYRDEFVKANLLLVVSIAKSLQNPHVSLLDRINDGNIGLFIAVERYDPNRESKFSTYATWWIRQTILRAIGDKENTIRLPVHMGEMVKRRNRALHELKLEGISISPGTLAARMGTTRRKATNLLSIVQQPLSLSLPINDEGSMLGDFIEDRKCEHPTIQLAAEQLRKRIEQVFSTLSEREAMIVKMRLGFDGYHEHTLKEIGDRLGLTRERIRQIEAKAFRKLRHPTRAEMLKDFVRMKKQKNTNSRP